MKSARSRILALVLVLAMIFGTGCGTGASSGVASQSTASGSASEANSESAPAEEGSRDVVVAMAQDVSSLYAYEKGSYTNNQVLWHPYEALISKNAEMEFIPLLAESWEMADDNLTWTFHLREGVKFHDGSDFTAEDVVASYDKASVAGESLFVEKLAYVDSYEAVDDYTFVVKTKMPYPLLLDDLMFVVITNKEDVEGKAPQEIAANINGTGRYKFVEWVPEDHIDFTVNENYWGEQPEVKNVRFRPITNVATRTAALLSGELDVAAMLAVQDVDRINNTDGVRVEAARSMECVAVEMVQTEKNPAVNLDVNPFLDVRVRKAFYMAIDLDSIVKNIYNGHVYPTTSMTAEGFNGYDAALERHPYDPEAAKALLAEAGYPDGFEVTLDASSVGFANSDALAQALASYWEKIGIKVNLNVMSTGFGSYIAQGAGNSGLSLVGWAMYTGDGISMQERQYMKWDKEAGTGGGNYGMYDNPDVSAKIMEAMQEMDIAKRGEMVKEIDRMVLDDVANIPLFFNENIFGVRDSIEYTPRYDRYLLAWEISFK